MDVDSKSKVDFLNTLDSPLRSPCQPWTTGYVKCYVKTEVMECNGKALRRGRMPKTTSLDIWIRIPSGHLYAWDLHSWWAIRSQSSDHPTLEPGGHIQSPAGLPLHRMCATPGAAWLGTDARLSTCRHRQWLGLCAGRSLCSLLSCKLPLCVTLLAYWGGLPNKPGIVERYKRLWVTPFRDAPLFTNRGGGDASLQVDLVLICRLLTFILRQSWLLGLTYASRENWYSWF